MPDSKLELLVNPLSDTDSNGNTYVSGVQLSNKTTKPYESGSGKSKKTDSIPEKRISSLRGWIAMRFDPLYVYVFKIHQTKATGGITVRLE